MGFSCDLLPVDALYWEKIGHTPARTFDQAAREALENEAPGDGLRGLMATLEEALIQVIGARLSPRG